MIIPTTLNIKYLKLLDWIPINKIDWYLMSKNPNAIPILKENLDRVDWYWLSANPNAMDILKGNLDRVDWYWLSANPNAMDIIKENLDRVDWMRLSSNPNAVEILEGNLDRVDWDELSMNPSIFIYDYRAMKNSLYKEGGFVEELMQNRFHPKNMEFWDGWGFSFE